MATEKSIGILDSHIAYVEEGAALRFYSVTLIGLGRSGKPDIECSFADHARYLAVFVDAMRLDRFVLVAQDRGTALAFDLAARRPEAVLGLAFMEFIRPTQSWDDFHQRDATRDLFRALRTPGEGERLIFEQNVFIEKVLPASILRTLSEEETEAYRVPHRRKPQAGA
jgi:haloalkane dehalogenase